MDLARVLGLVGRYGRVLYGIVSQGFQLNNCADMNRFNT